MKSELESLSALITVYSQRKYDSIEVERKHTLGILGAAETPKPSVKKEGSTYGEYEPAMKLVYERDPSQVYTPTELAAEVSVILDRKVEAQNIIKQIYKWRDAGVLRVADKVGRSIYYAYNV